MGCLGTFVFGVIVAIASSSQAHSPSANTLALPLHADTSTTSVAPPLPGSQWDYSHDEDAMTGKVSHTATVESENTVEFGFPYNGIQHGHLTIRRHPRYGNDIIFAVEKGQLLCPSYEGCSVLVRFDDGEPVSFSANPPADNSTESIFISNYDRFLSKMRSAKRVRISPRVYQEGSVVFTFDVSGFDVKKFHNQ